MAKPSVEPAPPDILPQQPVPGTTMDRIAVKPLEHQDAPSARPTRGFVPAAAPEPVTERIVARGKFLFVGEEKFSLKGVTYGTFRPDADGQPFPSPPQVEADFAQIAACGFNTVRTYT